MIQAPNLQYIPAQQMNIPVATPHHDSFNLANRDTNTVRHVLSVRSPNVKNFFDEQNFLCTA